MRFDRIHARAAGLLLLAGIGAGCSGADGPPAVTLDRSACGHCGMLVSELRTAAALRAADGTEQVFDDIGCLLNALHDHPGGAERIWVHDAAGERWLAADEALFTRAADVWTPMGSGLLAWPADAAPAGTSTLSFEQLLRDEIPGGQGHAR